MTASANLDLVRSIFAAWERGDYSSLDWADRDIEYVVDGGPDAGVFKGRVAMAKAWREVLTAFADHRSEVDEVREIDDERVLVLLRLKGRGKTSGLELDRTQAKVAALYHVRDGRVIRHVIYWDRDRAFADLGLAPEGDAASPPRNQRLFSADHAGEFRHASARAVPLSAPPKRRPRRRALFASTPRLVRARGAFGGLRASAGVLTAGPVLFEQYSYQPARTGEFRSLARHLTATLARAPCRCA
jgi:ketosteroid isomerase-like protein